MKKGALIKSLFISSLLLSGIFLTACGGGGGEGGTGGGGTGGGGSGGSGGGSVGLSNCNQSGYDIYLGYYAEDPSTNPEDPTGGYLVACIPDSNGAFRSQFLFSYSGCTGGVDIGTVDGNRTGNSISGNWSGTVDNRSIGGSFSGNWDGTKFSGTWNNSGGKVYIEIGDCSYHVAPNGTWALYRLDTDNGGLNIQVSGSPPTITWNNSIPGAQGFLVSVYDKQCVYDRISLSECTMWSVACSGSVNSLTYGTTPPVVCMNLFDPQTLTSGKDYLVSIIAYGSSQSDVRAFASKTFTAP